MPQHRNCGTCPRLNTPDTQLDEVPIMASYQPPHCFALTHPGENNAGAQSAGVSHQAQHAQGVMDGTPAHQMPTQTPAANEAEEAMG